MRRMRSVGLLEYESRTQYSYDQRLRPVRGTYAIDSCKPSQVGNQAALRNEAMRRRPTRGPVSASPDLRIPIPSNCVRRGIPIHDKFGVAVVPRRAAAVHRSTRHQPLTCASAHVLPSISAQVASPAISRRSWPGTYYHYATKRHQEKSSWPRLSVRWTSWNR